jgi:cyclin D1/2/4, plant
MAPSSYETVASILLCAEDSSSLMGFGAEEEEETLQPSRTRSGELAAAFPVPSEECVARLVESESEHMPSEDYAERLRAGGLDLRARMDAIDWIWKVGS